MEVGGKAVSEKWGWKCGSVVKIWDLCNFHFQCLAVMWKC